MDLSYFAVWKLNTCMIKILPLKNLSNTKIYGPNDKCYEWKEDSIGLEDFMEEEKLELDMKKGFVGFGRWEDRKALQTRRTEWQN